MNGSIKSRGFSLIEMLIAIVILSISLLALAALMATTTQNNSFGAHMSEATTFAQDMLERLRAGPWENVVSNADQVTSSTGITYDRNWVVSPNPTSPSDTLREVTISINWNNNNNSIRVLSVISD